MPDAAYYREWRAAHPGYRARQNELRRARRSRMSPEERRRDRGLYKPVEPVEPIPPVWVAGQDPLVDLAWGYISHCPRGTVVSFREDELALDAVGVAVLAMLEHRDPKEAVRAFYAVETNWLTRAAPFLLDDGLDEP